MTNSAYKLYGRANAGSLAIQIALEEIGAPYDLIWVGRTPAELEAFRRINPAEHPDWPEGLTQVDFGELKQKLLGSIVGIAAVDALAWYFDLEKEPDTAKLIWVLAFPLTFAACMLILAISDRLGRRSDNGSG